MNKRFKFKKDRIKATIDITLREKENKKQVLSMCGTIYFNNKIIYYGQCIGEIKDIFKSNKLVKKLFILWEKYHLNDMHAGTVRQEKALKKAKLLGVDKYTKACDYLEKIGLYDDDGNIYGKSWYYHPIPKKDLEEIKKLIGDK